MDRQNQGSMKSGVTSDTTISARHREKWDNILNKMTQLAGPGNLDQVLVQFERQVDYALSNPTQESRIVLQGKPGGVEIVDQAHSSAGGSTR